MINCYEQRPDFEREDSADEKVQYLQSELSDLRKCYQIATGLVGLTPSQQRGQGEYYRNLLSRKDWPNVRDLVQRLLTIAGDEAIRERPEEGDPRRDTRMAA